MVTNAPWAMRGYQADIDGQNRYTGQNYEERGRTFLALRGQMTRLEEGKTPQIIATLGETNELMSVIRNEDWNEYHLIASGNVLIAFAWSGDIQGLRADNPDLQWIAPREGAILFSDNMMIPKTSDRQDLAMAWIDWCYDPAHSAQIVSGAPYISDVKGAGAALAKIAPALAGSELVNPPPELVQRLHVFRTLSDDEEAEFNRVFQRAIGA